MASIKNRFRVPDYYKSFVCKCGECRHNCCQGWNITLNMNEYFRLIGMDCDPELRHRLDIALALLEDPSEERYAVMKLNYFGVCQLLDGDGYCSLQRKCGEAAITDVCRQYPRSPKCIGEYECCCSNSCEAVIEALIGSITPTGYEELELSFDHEIEKSAPQKCRKEMMECTYRILYKRTLSLSCRLSNVAKLLYGIDASYKDECTDKTVVLLDSFVEKEDFTESDINAFNDILYLVRRFSETSPEMKELYGRLLESYGCDETDKETMYKKYRDQLAKLKMHFPDLEIWFEKILVNHINYEGFQLPFTTQLPFAEALALCALYAMMKLFTAALTGNEAPKNDFTDVLAGLFRFAEHSSFDNSAVAILLKRGYDDPQSAARLAAL